MADNIYYRDKDFVVRNSKASDAVYLYDKLRKDDVQEIWDSHNHTPKEALDICVSRGTLSFTVEHKKEPVFIFGVYAENFIANKATLWMLGSDKVDSIYFKIGRLSKKFTNYLLSMYPYLYNYVSVENKKAIRYLEHIGATINEPMIYGMEHKYFRHFYFNK